MLTRKGIVIRLAILGFLTTGSFAQSSIPELISRVQPSVVKIETFDRQGKPSGSGSGFFVGKESIITNKHVIDGASRATARLDNGSIISVLRIESSDEFGDLSLLKVPRMEKIVPIPISKFAPKVGEQVVVIGSPLGLDGSVTNGIVSAFRQSSKLGNLIQITAPISPGSSGSPVINTLGHVIGVATSYLENGQNLNFAISSDRIIKLWQSQIVIAGEGVPTSKLSENDVDACGKSPYPYDTSLSDPWDYIFKGQDLLSAGRLSEAKEAFKRAVNRNPAMPEAQFSLWKVYSELWYKHKTTDCYEKMVVSARQAMNLRPKEQQFRSALALSLMVGENMNGAEKVLRDGIQLSPKDPENYSLLGECLFLSGRQEDSFSYFEKARKLDSKHSNAYVGLVRVYIYRKDKAKAIEILKELEKIDAEKALVVEKEIIATFPNKL